MVIKMKWNDRFHEVIEYIEICLQQYHEDISVKDIESIMDCSYDLFQKMFSYQCGLGFSEYIRNRKMTLAGYDLKSTDLKVIEISYKYGYESPTSFTKAFQTFHGVSPSIARKNEVMLKTYPKMKLNLKKSYPWFLERKEKMRIIGKSIELVKEDLNNEQLIPAFWSQCFQDGTFAQLVEMDESSRKGCFGLFCNQPIFPVLSGNAPAGNLEKVADAKEKKQSEVKKKTAKKIKQKGLQDGEYTGSAKGFGGLIVVKVQIFKGKIKSIDVVSHEKETPAYYSKAKKVISLILSSQSTDVDTISGATFSSSGILQAVQNALRNAGGKKEKSSVKIAAHKTNKKEQRQNKVTSLKGIPKDGVYTGTAECEKFMGFL